MPIQLPNTRACIEEKSVRIFFTAITHDKDPFALAIPNEIMHTSSERLNLKFEHLLAACDIPHPHLACDVSTCYIKATRTHSRDRHRLCVLCIQSRSAFVANVADDDGTALCIQNAVALGASAQLCAARTHIRGIGGVRAN